MNGSKIRLPPVWLNVPWAIFVARWFTLHLSDFGWYHGFNEAVYTQVAIGYDAHPWLPMRDGAPFFDTGPFTTYMMWASYHIINPWAGSPGAEEAALRVGVFVAYPIAVLAAYLAAESFYGPGKGKVAALLVSTSPWVILWFGRAQTDAWMVTGVLLFLAGIAKPTGRRVWLIPVGLIVGVLSKQPALLLVPFTPILVRGSQAEKLRVSYIALASAFVACLWWGAMLLAHGDAMWASLKFHTESRVRIPGENWLWTMVALAIGPGALLGFSFLGRGQKHSPALAIAFGFYALFAVFDSPIGHEYYALPAVAILCVLAAGWKWSPATLSACVVASLLLSVPVLAYAGDLGGRQDHDMGEYLTDPHDWYFGKVPANASVSAPDRLVPQLELYSHRTVLYSSQVNQTEGAFIVSWNSLPCPEVAKTGRTFSNVPLRLFDCRHRSQDVSETVDSPIVGPPAPVFERPSVPPWRRFDL